MRVQHTNETRAHGAQGETLKRVRTDLETVRNWYMWFTQGLGHLAGRKGGETRYWVYVIRHLNIAYPVHPPTRCTRLRSDPRPLTASTHHPQAQ